MKRLALLFALCPLLLSAQVQWKVSLADKGKGEVELVATAMIDDGWHLYDVNIPDGGPNATTLSIDELKGAEKVGPFRGVDSHLHKEFDAMFDMEIGYYEDKASFAQRFKVTDRAAFRLRGDIRAQACNDTQCTPPLPVDFDLSAKDLPATVIPQTDKTAAAPAPAATTAAPQAASTEPELVEPAAVPVEAVPAATVMADSTQAKTDLWQPVIEELRAYGAEGDTSGYSLWWIFILGFGGGLLALLTPCVWPMIPMIVSFFLKSDKGRAVRNAMIYGLSIIVIYMALGLTITALFGPSALNAMSTSAWFNLFFFALLAIFAASFLGAFEIVLPSSWTNRADSKVDSTTGLVSIFFMAFTLTLVSFSCTGPIIGTLLVDAVSSGTIIAPAIGMLGFAIALAIPFTLFAMFPSWLKSLPKSGGWLNTVKVVLGFVELALALKFLSVADLAYGWGILDRELFLALWILIFGLLGLYLLGKIRFRHDSPLEHVSVGRLSLALVSLAFALWMIPGLWGAPLKAISAFSPPMYTQTFSMYKGDVHAKFDDYDEGMAYAARTGKPVFIDFSGFGCVNCRKMEASVWTDPRVKSILEEDFVLITLMVDDKQPLPEAIEVEENGGTTRLKTVGDRWSWLQRHKFGTSSQPYYVMLDNGGHPIGPSYAYDKSIDKYLKFLSTGLGNYRK